MSMSNKVDLSACLRTAVVRKRVGSCIHCQLENFKHDTERLRTAVRICAELSWFFHGTTFFRSAHAEMRFVMAVYEPEHTSQFSHA